MTIPPVHWVRRGRLLHTVADNDWNQSEQLGDVTCPTCLLHPRANRAVITLWVAHNRHPKLVRRALERHCRMPPIEGNVELWLSRRPCLAVYPAVMAGYLRAIAEHLPGAMERHNDPERAWAQCRRRWVEVWGLLDQSRVVEAIEQGRFIIQLKSYGAPERLSRPLANEVLLRLHPHLERYAPVHMPMNPFFEPSERGVINPGVSVSGSMLPPVRKSSLQLMPGDYPEE